jgi:hypothetical protein
MADVALAIKTEPNAVATGRNESALIGLVERLLVHPTLDAERAERFLKMYVEEEKRRAVNAFNEAMSFAKGEIGPITKNRTVDFTGKTGMRTNYKYEDLAEIARVVDPVFKKYGLSYRFRSEQNGQKLKVTCIVSHALGHFEENSLEAAEDHSGNKNPTQAIGSTATFLQRYTLKLSAGLAASNDMDGRTQPADEQEVISDAQQAELRALITATNTDIDKFLAFGGVESLADLKSDGYKRAKSMLLTKKAEQEKAAKGAAQ